MRRPKHGHKAGFRRWKSRAGKRHEWVLNQINKVTLEHMKDKLADLFFVKGRQLGHGWINVADALEKSGLADHPIDIY